MATVTRYVNTASSGGDGTTNAESGANAAYASLNAWEAAEATDLVTAGDSHIVYVSTGSGTAADTTAVSVGVTWVTDATHTLTIEQASTDRHGGVLNSLLYRLTAVGSVLTVQVSYVTLNGLQLVGDSGSSTGALIYQDDAAGVVVETTISNCLMAINGSLRRGILLLGTYASTFTAINNIMYGGYDGIRMQGFESASFAYNNTVYGMGNTGFTTTFIDMTAINNVVRNCTNGFNGTFATASDYNSSDISGDAPNTGGSGNDNTASPWYSGATADSAIFVDAANDDYHLTSGSTIFDSVGANLYSTFTDDIEGDARPNAAFDLGADEYVSAAGAALTTAISGTATVAAAITTAITAAASLGASSAVAAVLTTSITLGSALLGTSAVAPALTTSITPAASISATGTVVPALTTAITTPAASISATGTVVPALTTSITPAASISASGAITPALTTSITPAASISASGAITPALTTSITPAASISATGTVVPALTTAITPAASISATGAVAPALTTDSALVTRYVNTASAGGDGTTNAESGATAAYSSLNAWEAAEATDLVTAGNSHIVYVSTGSGTAADTAAVRVTGWTTDATHTLTIQGEAFGGKYNTSVYRLEVTAPRGAILEIGVGNVFVYDLQIKLIYTADLDYAFKVNYAVDNVLFDRCLGWSSGGARYVLAFFVGSSAAVVTLRNSIMINESVLYHVIMTYGFLTIDNVTAIGGYYGFLSGGGAPTTVTNSVTRGAVDGFYGTFTPASDYNSSDISGDAPNTGGSGNNNTLSPWYSGATADADIFVDAANGDYHLVSGATIFNSVGANLYSTFTDDIDGEIRHNAAFDLGADGYISAAGTRLPIFAHYYNLVLQDY